MNFTEDKCSLHMGLANSIISSFENKIETHTSISIRNGIIEDVISFFDKVKSKSIMSLTDNELGNLLAIGHYINNFNVKIKVEFIRMVSRIINYQLHYSPGLLRFYYPGLLSIQLWNNENTLFRYSCEEKILILLREVGYYFELWSNEMKCIDAGLLHSIMYFLRKCQFNRIGTYRSQKLLSCSAQLFTKKIIGDINDQYILQAISDNQIRLIDTFDGLKLDTPYLSYFSIIYNSHSILTELYNEHL